MEPVGSTYNQPLVSGILGDRNALEMRQTRSEPGESKSRESALAVVTSGKVQEQKGLQPSGSVVEEFKPYSPLRSQKSSEAGDTKKSQNNNLPSVDTKEEQDPQVQAQVAQLKAIEVKVKAHEAAHKSAGGTMTGPVSYSYTRGPDGKNYITGGEVPISISTGKTPRETISRMQQVIQAALAPADPSPQDRAVAAQAATQQQQARQELATAPETETTEATPVSVESGNRGDSRVARDTQRAYGDPMVTGKQSEMPVIAAAKQKPQGAASSLTDATESSFSPMTTSGINGFGSPQPVSYYA